MSIPRRGAPRQQLCLPCPTAKGKVEEGGCILDEPVTKREMLPLRASAMLQAERWVLPWGRVPPRAEILGGGKT